MAEQLWPFDFYLSACHEERSVHLHDCSGLHRHKNLCYILALVRSHRKHHPVDHRTECQKVLVLHHVAKSQLGKLLSLMVYTRNVKISRRSVPALNFVFSWSALLWQPFHCVSRIEIVNELVKIFKTTQNHVDRWRSLVRNRFMLTSRLARFVMFVKYLFICFFQALVQNFHMSDRFSYGKRCRWLEL